MSRCKKCLLAWENLGIEESLRQGHCHSHEEEPKGVCKEKILGRHTIEVVSLKNKTIRTLTLER